MKQLFFILALCHLFSANAQQIEIRGNIKDAVTKQPLGYCTITLDGHRFIANDKGYFSLNIAKKQAKKIVIQAIGYQTDSVLISNFQFPASIYLQPAVIELNDVVVTGVTKATLIRENPVAINHVSAKTIDRTIAPNVIDGLACHVAGLQVVKTGPNISKPFIRGLGYNRVLTLYDGLRQEGQQWGDEHGIEVDAYNIENAEVIKGPASLQFGSDAVAGVVSLFPTLPKMQDGKIHGRWLSEYQTNNGLIGNGFRLGCHNGHWFWTANGGFRLAKNYRNAVDGWVYNTNFRETNVGATLGYKFKRGTSSLNVTLYNNLQGIPDGSRDSATRQFTYQREEGLLDTINKRPIVPYQSLNTYHLSPLHQHIQHSRIYWKHRCDWGKSGLDAMVGWQQNTRREYSHPTAPKQAALYVRLNTVNYHLAYHFATGNQLEWATGINGMYQDNKSLHATDFPIPDFQLLDVGGYVFGKWSKDALTVSGGIRLDTRKLWGSDFYVRENAATGFSQQAHWPDTTGAVLQFPALKRLFQGISTSIGLTYRFNNYFSIKANLARGYRSPSITELAANGLDPGAHIVYLGNRSFEPEFSWQQDVGFIWQHPSIDASIGLFNNTIQHYIYLTQLVDADGNALSDAQGNKTYQYQQDKAQLYGGEATLAIHPESWSGLEIRQQVSLVNGKNKKSIYQWKGNGGENLPLMPPLKWVSSVGKEIKLKNKHWNACHGGIEMEYSAPQNRYLALNNTETAMSSYTLFHVSGGIKYQLKNGQSIQLEAQVNNMFDAVYQSNLSRLKYFEYYSSSPNGRLGIYNMGRNVSGRIIVSF